MGRGSNVLLGAAATAAIGTIALYAQSCRTPPPATIAQVVVTPQPRHSPLTIEQPDGKCVEPEQRRTWVINPGDTALGIAYAIEDAIEDETTHPAIVRAYELLKLNSVDERLLLTGQPFVTHNAGLMPKIILPQEPIILEEGQPLSLKIGLEGLLCGGGRIQVSGAPLFARFDNSTHTLQWTPRALQAGTYSVSFNAGDRDFSMGRAYYEPDSGRMRYDESPRSGTVDIRVKVKSREFVTEGEPGVKYRIVPANDEFTQALTIDGKTSYVLQAYRQVADFDVVSAQQLAANPEVAFAILHQRMGGYTISSGSELGKAVDHLRRVMETGNKPREIEPFTFPKVIGGEQRTAYWFPVLKGEIQLDAAVK